ncbi:MAG TPA: YIP1 family protein [Pyrinomonadaceae bacterium]|nr:YIP1 family protein [Pyrinomonadaceae bacterium]
MNRLAGIVTAAVGLIIAILGAIKIVPGVTGTGVFLILFGGLVIGLSFINRPETEDTEKMSTAATLGNIFFAPSDTFKNLRRHPRFVVALLIMTVLSATYTNLFFYRLGTERVVNFTIDKTLEMGMIANNEDAKKQVEAGRAQAIADAKSPVMRVTQTASTFAGFGFTYAILAGIFMLFALAMGGKINFFQAFSAAVYAAFPVSVIKFVLNTIVLFLKDPTEIHPVLGQQSLVQDSLNFLVLPAEHPVIFTLLGATSLLGLYWVWLNATGLKNAGERVTGTIAWSASLGIFFVIILLGVVMATLFPSFIS